MKLAELVSEMHAAGMNYAEALQVFRRCFVLQILVAHYGSRTQAARELGVHRNTMTRMLRELDMALVQMAG